MPQSPFLTSTPRFDRATLSAVTQPIVGHCHCRSITFQLTSPVDFCSNCHCADCRLTHAAPFVTWTSVPRDRFHLNSGADRLTRYESHPGVEWIFCSRCGSSLFYESTEAPDRVYIAVATLDPKTAPTPDSHVSYEERLPWFHDVAKLPCFREKTDEQIPFA